LSLEKETVCNIIMPTTTKGKKKENVLAKHIVPRAKEIHKAHPKKNGPNASKKLLWNIAKSPEPRRVSKFS